MAMAMIIGMMGSGDDDGKSVIRPDDPLQARLAMGLLTMMNNDWDDGPDELLDEVYEHIHQDG